ncbi:alpha-2,3-sialyltransferase [Helicobacter pametensis]|uniref:alpha-2,3-sialyltransferase n=1 Tax=Helicobacter pametensis TaxID=95149 RepID=UPI0004B05FE8|nr:alpha-2,3-sialyltransferase [Helicobacter pametensis]
MKPIIIAGNGPSLAQIDYSRLPKDFDVFRCNQFYFEDRYFLGKKIKGVFFNHRLIWEFFFTMNQIRQRYEYEIQDLYSCLSPFDCEKESFEYFKTLKHYFPTVIDFYPYLREYKMIYEQILHWYLYEKKFLNMGTYMLITALAQGYKEIYLVGIDFYEGRDYAFNMSGKKNLYLKIPAFEEGYTKISAHNQSFDRAIIQMIQNLNLCTLYSLSPSSPMSQFIPLAPIQSSVFSVLQKPKNYIDDLLIPDLYPLYKKDKVKNQSILSKIKSLFSKDHQ